MISFNHFNFNILNLEKSLAFHEKHQKMGVVCFENPGMGIYFISDPDGYWIEIVPERG